MCIESPFVEKKKFQSNGVQIFLRLFSLELVLVECIKFP